MIALLNLLPFFLALGAVIFAAHAWAVYPKIDKDEKFRASFKRSGWTSITLIALIFVVHQLTPSYMPKGSVNKLQNPAFEKSSSEIEDRLKKPELSKEEREERFNSIFNSQEQLKQK